MTFYRQDPNQYNQAGMTYPPMQSPYPSMQSPYPPTSQERPTGLGWDVPGDCGFDEVASLRWRLRTAEAIVAQQRDGIKSMQRTCAELEVELRRLQQAVPFRDWLAALDTVSERLMAGIAGWRIWLVRELLGERYDDVVTIVGALRWAIEAQATGNLGPQAKKFCDDQLAGAVNSSGRDKDLLRTNSDPV
jgi:hypothetical protein